MKRINLLILAALLSLFGYVAIVKAASPFTVTVSTVVPNGSTNGSLAFTNASYPNITGGVKIRKIYVTNQAGGAAAVGETVSIWGTCTSSTTASLKWSGFVPSSSTISVDILPGDFTVTSPCISKGITDSSSVLKATLFYE